MIAVIFEVEFRPGAADEYFALAAELRAELEGSDGFLGVERFASLTQEGRYLSVSLWRDEAAVRRWHEHAGHRAAQARGKAALFSRYRIRVAEVLREHGSPEPGDAPGEERP